jgi:hypothetical protein
MSLMMHSPGMVSAARAVPHSICTEISLYRVVE